MFEKLDFCTITSTQKERLKCVLRLQKRVYHVIRDH